MRRGSEISINLKPADELRAKATHAQLGDARGYVALDLDIEGPDHASSVQLYFDAYRPELRAALELIAATINHAEDLAVPENALSSRQQLQRIVDREGLPDIAGLRALTEAYELGRAAERVTRDEIPA